MLQITAIKINYCDWCGQSQSKGCDCSEIVKNYKEPFNKHFWFEFLKDEEFECYVMNDTRTKVPSRYRFDHSPNTTIRFGFRWIDLDTHINKFFAHWKNLYNGILFVDWDYDVTDY